jgi:hypothetical protein
MKLLQIYSSTNTVNSLSSGNEIYIYLEILIICAIIGVQAFTFYKVLARVIYFRNIFKHNLNVETAYIKKDLRGKITCDDKSIVYTDKSNDDSYLNIALIARMGKDKNNTIKKIRDNINTYLLNNYGAAVNFSIIKDIVDREVDVKDEEITQTITIPLYLGLAATMVGIILGLFAMPDLNAKGFSDGVNSLINGVKIAMIASLSGLALTTFLSSWFYKNAKTIVLNHKNENITIIQAKLLPELIKAEDTGVSGLKASLDRFAREAQNISDNVLIAANQTGENLTLQQEVIDKVENMEALKVSKLNLELFDKIDSNMDSFERFSTYLSSMEKISENLLNFSERTQNVDTVINQIGTSLKDSRELTEFLSAHFKKIEAVGNAAMAAVDIADMHFDKAIEALKSKTDGVITLLYDKADRDHQGLTEVYTNISDELTDLSAKYVEKFEQAFSDSIPKFDNLNLLPEIKHELRKENNAQNKSAETLDNIHKSLEFIEKNINNQPIITKLESIDKNLETRKTRTNPPRTNPPPKPDTPSKKPNPPIGIVKVIKDLFLNE